MFNRLFVGRPTPRSAITDVIYTQIVAAARQPVPYSHWLVPDTPLGRFEMIGLHMFLFLHRIREEKGAVSELGQDVTDMFFTEVDHSLRELGIGDVSMPKRMKKLARMYYGRFESYGGALDAGDEAMLEEALKRNIRPDADAWPQAAELARYVVAANTALMDQTTDGFCAGQLVFPHAGAGTKG